VQADRDLPLVDELVDGAVFVVQISYEADATRALAEAGRGNALLKARIAEDALLRAFKDSVEVYAFVRAGLRAEAIPVATLLVDGTMPSSTRL
jgi:hypothetical protein